jgi:hypothetical protein
MRERVGVTNTLGVYHPAVERAAPGFGLRRQSRASASGTSASAETFGAFRLGWQT